MKNWLTKLFSLPAIGLTFVLLIPGSADAYRLIQQTGGIGTYTAGAAVAMGSGTTVRWIPRTMDFRVNSTGAGDGLTFNQTRNAVRDAYAAWQDVACSGIAFNYLGDTTAIRSPTDGNNTTYWAETGDNEYTGPAAILGPGTLAVTIITIRANQTLTDVDIAFNGRDFNWALGDTAANRDIQDTATHEIGHMIGFHHTEITATPRPTMWAFDQGGNASRTLEADDVNAVCFLYPRLSGAGSIAAGDFNGDGRTDLATGVPNEGIGTILGAGAVNVIYGTGSGLSATNDQIWHQDMAGIQGGSEQFDHFGSAVAAGDFNNDGFDDLAIGVRNESINAIAGAGAVNVIYGSGSGLTAANDQIWHQNTAGVLGGSEAGDQFGSALVAADFDNDGFDDLAIGVPNESIGTIAGAGAVNVLYGTSAGLSAAGDQLWHQANGAVLGGSEANDHMGLALTAGDFNNDRFYDLVIGVPNESIGNIAGAGAVNVLYGTATGLLATNDQIWHQNSSGILGGSEVDDNFGASLTIGDFNRDRFDDLAIGVPSESIGSIADAGAVNIIYGSGSGLTSANDQIWHQNSSGILGGSEANDSFAATLTAGDYDNDGFDDLAIGVPIESIGSILGAGAVNVIYGSNSRLGASGNQIWHQNSPGIAGGSEADDQFGASLTSGKFSGGSFMGIAAGVRNESIGAIPGAGAVNVIYGSGSGLSSANDQIWHQNVPGIEGAAEANDGFGGAE